MDGWMDGWTVTDGCGTQNSSGWLTQSPTPSPAPSHKRIPVFILRRFLTLAIAHPHPVWRWRCLSRCPDQLTESQETFVRACVVCAVCVFRSVVAVAVVLFLSLKCPPPPLRTSVLRASELLDRAVGERTNLLFPNRSVLIGHHHQQRIRPATPPGHSYRRCDCGVAASGGR